MTAGAALGASLLAVLATPATWVLALLTFFQFRFVPASDD